MSVSLSAQISRSRCQSEELRDLEPHDDTRAAHPDVAHQPLESVAAGHRRARLPLIAVDDDDALLRPPEGGCPLAKRVLALRALGVFKDLPKRRLPDV